MEEHQRVSSAFISSPVSLDVAQRLQQMVIGWRGAERGEPLSSLHQQCQQAAGPGGMALLPARLLPVKALDTTTLQAAVARSHGRGQIAQVRFRVPPVGRFDSALLPMATNGEPVDRWLLAIEETLPLRDQVALYAHALGHLLLNRDVHRMGGRPPLNYHDGYGHADMLGELRQPETIRSMLDQRVLEAYPTLANLLNRAEEVAQPLALLPSDFRERLAESGWKGSVFVETPYIFTNGRIFVSGATVRRRRRLQADALLRAEASLPIALVQMLRPGEKREEAVQRLIDYAHDRLRLPFGFLMEESGSVQEFDWTTSRQAAVSALEKLPTREQLLTRWTTQLGLTDEPARRALLYPYQLSGVKPRYYQEAAINRAVIAVLQAKRNRRKPRILLTMATGTGKTPVAFQIVWKLKKSHAIGNVLFITDRDYLLGQAMDNAFAPFGDARQRIQGEATTSRDVLFATYQAIADQESREGLYRRYPRDFFDLVIIDECHRGSAQDESNWRSILDHFNSAVQIGLTATPLRTENIQTYEYFGEPLVDYSLRQGITDGFLAPYRVRRVLMGHSAEIEEHDVESQSTAAPDEPPEANNLPLPSEASMAETNRAVIERTPIIAEHLAKYLRESGDPMAKTIVFCVDQSHAEMMRAALARACAEQMARHQEYVVRIVADEGYGGKRALGRFSTPDEPTPVIVTTSKLLTTGVDVPTCKNIVLARPVGSMVEFKQIIGRGTRLHDKKSYFTIIDYAGATHHFFDPAFDGDPEQVEIEVIEEPAPATADQNRQETDDSLVIPPTVGAGRSQGNEPVQENETGAKTSKEQPGYQETTATSQNPVHDGQKGYPNTLTSATEEGTPIPLPQHTAGQALSTPAGASKHPNYKPKAPMPTAIASQGHTRARDGVKYMVIGEILYELGPDGKTLTTRSYRDYTKDALHSICGSPVELRARWLRKEQQEEIKARLVEEGVNLDELAKSLGLSELDPLDVLLHVAFDQPALTRRERADRVKREHAAFFARYSPKARQILEIILAKYVAGEAEDVSDTQLLRVPPLDSRGTFVELAQPFGGGAGVRNALKELQTLLYSA